MHPPSQTAMQQAHVSVNFRKIEEFPTFEQNVDLAKDPARVQDLARYVVTWYHHDEAWNQYQAMITEAIKSNNIDGLETLWSGIYFHDRSSPDFLTDVYNAAQASIQTFLHVLYAYMNYHTVNYAEPIELSSLTERASGNPLVSKFVGQIAELFQDGELHPLPEIDKEETGFAYFSFIMGSNVMKGKSCVSLEEVSQKFGEIDMDQDEHTFNVRRARFYNLVTEFIRGNL